MYTKIRVHKYNTHNYTPPVDDLYETERFSWIVISVTDNGTLFDFLRSFDTEESAFDCFIDEVVKFDDRITREDAYMIGLEEGEYADSGTIITVNPTYDNYWKDNK